MANQKPFILFPFFFSQIEGKFLGFNHCKPSRKTCLVCTYSFFFKLNRFGRFFADPGHRGILDSGLFLLKTKQAVNDLKKASKYWKARPMTSRKSSFVGEKMIRSFSDDLLFVQFLYDQYQLSRDLQFSISKAGERTNSVSNYYSLFSGNKWRTIMNKHRKGTVRDKLL